MSVTPTTRDAFDLLLQGSLTLARMEHHGLRVDTEYLSQALEDTSRRIGKLEAGLRKGEVWQVWEQTFGSAANLGSRSQLGKVLFDVLKHPAPGRTEQGHQWKTDDEALSSLGDPWLDKYLRCERLKKARGTYLEGLQREVVGGFVHPNFKLHSVDTFRSSCSDPNVQNQIVRNEELAAVIRRCYVPRPGHWFYEVDYGSLEFRGAACFWQDPAMVRYASDFELDIHRDMAARLYRLAKNKVSKKARYCAKNMFVFPTLYGSDYINCARNLWEAISKHALENGDGLGLHAHLANLGITRLGQLDRQREPEPGTLEEHVRGVERWFMGKFSTFAQKRRDWWRQYQERGWFDLLTGFRLKGHYSKNFLMNSIVQGPSFHLMLWSLIQIDKELRRRKLKTRLVAEIHDSLLADGPPEEAQEFLDLCERVMTRDVRKHWGWVITPLTVEVDVADDSWAGKKPWIKRDGAWQPKEQVSA